ncbi:MAG: P-II family nitrogen regulator [Bacilli bacterium]
MNQNNGKEVISEKREYSLILAIVNKGNTDLVMQAARKAGSRGGTISVARGTGNPELAKTYGLVIQPEKEMVFIVVSNDIKDEVMKQIYDDAGISTQGSGIIVSLPISDAIGLDPLDE